MTRRTPCPKCGRHDDETHPTEEVRLVDGATATMKVCAPREEIR